MTPAELKAWRTTQSLTQPALAALLGIHEMTLSRWENGDRLIPPYLHLALESLSAHRRRRSTKTEGGPVP